jgi:2'-5' RNA ligase
MELMESRNNGAQPVNSYALVTYIPAPLGRFLDELRCEIVPACVPRAHVTILPPRPLAITAAEAWNQLSMKLRDFPAFEIECGGVEMFAATSVIYIAVKSGREELRRMHDLLNAGGLCFEEPFVYHPHITVAQELAGSDVPEAFEAAKRRWAEYRGIRTFPVEAITFVQNTMQNRWLDLAHCVLGTPQPVR